LSEDRPFQREAVLDLLTQASRGNQLLASPTGTGKTDMALIRAAQQTKLGGSVFFVVPYSHLVDQTLNKIRERFQPDIPVVSEGSALLAQRDAKREPRLVVITAGALERALAVIRAPFSTYQEIFSPADLLILDETHNASGKHSMATVLERAKAAGAAILLVSATPGKNRQAIKQTQRDSDIPSIVTPKAPERSIDRRLRKIALSPEILHVAELLKDASGVAEHYFTHCLKESVRSINIFVEGQRVPEECGTFDPYQPGALGKGLSRDLLRVAASIAEVHDRFVAMCGESTHAHPFEILAGAGKSFQGFMKECDALLNRLIYLVDPFPELSQTLETSAKWLWPARASLQSWDIGDI
jgi:hypothetical protein